MIARQRFVQGRKAPDFTDVVRFRHSLSTEPHFCAVQAQNSFSTLRGRSDTMKTWTRPDFKEVSLGCEINSYSPSEI